MAKQKSLVRRLLLISLSAGCILFSAGCGTSGSDDSAPAESVLSDSPALSSVSSDSSTLLSANGIYMDPDKDFQLVLPENWTASETSQDNSAIFLSPEGDCSLEIKKQSADQNLLAYSEAEFTQSYQSQLDDFQLKSRETVTINGNKGVFLTYTCTQQNTTYTIYQYILAGDYDYNFTYSTVNDTPSFRDLVTSSIETFRQVDPDHDPSLLLGRLDGQTYHDLNNRFTVTLPSAWKISQQKTDQILFTSGDKKANINILISDVDKKLFQYKKSYFTEYFESSLGKSATITQFSTVTINGSQAIYLECSYPKNGQTLLAKQYLINNGDYTYTLTATATTANAQKIDFKAVAESLQFTESE